jgi:hypothetical protein
MHVVFLTPPGALVGPGVVLPAAATLLRDRRDLRRRRARQLAARTAAILSVAGLVAAAAAQPAVARDSVLHARTDAAAYVVVDISRSMLASQGRRGETRFARAVTAARRLRADLGGVPVGLAGMNDRVEPDLFPSLDVSDFGLTAERGLTIGSPPPQSTGPRGTNLEALTTLATDGYFTGRDHHRLAVVLTDGETAGFAPGNVAAVLRRAHIRVLVVRFWHADERIFDGRGREDPRYRPSSGATGLVADFARATGGAVFGEQDLGAVAVAARHALGRGPATSTAGPRRLSPLAPYLFAVAALPLAFLLLRTRRRRRIATAPLPSDPGGQPSELRAFRRRSPGRV